MSKFGFVVHPIDLAQVRNFWPLARILPGFALEFILEKMPAFKVSHIRGIRSTQNKEVEGYFIACPLLPKQMLEFDESFVLDKIISAGKIAQRLGCQILGLGGYTSIIGDKGFAIAKNLKIPVTSGNSLTAWSVCEAIYKTAEAKNVNLSKSTLAVIGATGSIGSLCTRRFAPGASKIIINAKHRDKLERLKGTLGSAVEVEIEMDAHQAIKSADIVITTTSAPEALLSADEFKSNAIICDVSIPKNVVKANQGRQDITLIEGGLIKLPYEPDFGADTGLPKNIIYACMAETMLLALEQKFISFSLGDNINLEQLSEMEKISEHHGFEVWLPNNHLVLK